MPSLPPTAIALISIALFSCLDALLGYLTNILGIPIYQSIFIRTSLVCVLASSYVICTGTPHAPFGPPAVRHLMWIRGGLITIGLISGYSSLRYLTISEFLTIYCCLPFPTGLLCWMLLGEKFTRVQGICCGFSMLGVIMITDPLGRSAAFEDNDLNNRTIDDHIDNDLVSKLTGLAICLPSVLSLAGEMTVMRFIKDQASTFQIMVIISFCPAIVSAVVMASTGIAVVLPDHALGWVLLAFLVPCGLGAQYTLTYASSRLPGVHVTICSYAGIIFSTTIQWLLYGNHPSAVAFLGMAVIATSGIYAVMYGPGGEDSAEQQDLSPQQDIEMPLLREDASWT